MGQEVRDIRERAADYALRAIQLYRHLLRKRDGVGSILGKQYLRSATSIGANLIEAQAGESSTTSPGRAKLFACSTISGIVVPPISYA